MSNGKAMIVHLIDGLMKKRLDWAQLHWMNAIPLNVIRLI